MWTASGKKSEICRLLTQHGAELRDYLQEILAGNVIDLQGAGLPLESERDVAEDQARDRAEDAQQPLGNGPCRS